MCQMMKIKLSGLRRASAVVFLLSFVVSVAISQTSSATPPQVKIAGSQLLHLTSTIVGREYDLYVNLPRGYEDTTKRFPVLYLLDAQWDFPLAQALYGELFYDGFVPSAIIVGITWGGKNPDYDSLRARDFTPTQSGRSSRFGGGQTFLSFIKAELIPFVESRFRTAKNDRALMGSSLGGLFTLYALFHEPGLFNRYVLTSPSVGWDNGVLFTDEKEYAARHTQLSARVSMAVGGLEMGNRGGFEKFLAQMKSRSYTGLQLEARVLENTGHSGSKAEGYARGLQFVFAKPALALPREVLNRYSGKYGLTPQMSIEFVEDDGNLALLAPGNVRIPLSASSDTTFYAKGMFLIVTFKQIGSGGIRSCEVEEYSGKQVLPRIN